MEDSDWESTLIIKIINMNLLAISKSKSLSVFSLTNLICFNASKMQASSTQKTKDSAGRRLGYLSLQLV